MTIEQRFWYYANRIPEGCWEWSGPGTSAGYAQLSVGGGSYNYAHRFSFELHKGTIPEGLTIDHLCRNTRCVNPEHLEAVPIKVNILRGTSPNAVNARKVDCKRGHPLTGSNLIINSGGTRTCRECIRMLNREWYARHSSEINERRRLERKAYA